MNNTMEQLKTGQVRIVVVDDHPIVREGLVGLLSRQPMFDVCGEAANVEEALTVVADTRPDVVLVDLLLQGQDGLDLIRAVHEKYRDIRMLVISMQDETLYAERALRAGASGYIMKDEVTSNIVQAIEAVMAGDIFLSRVMNVRLLKKLIEDDMDDDLALVRSLSDRELHVFQLIGSGVTIRDIADNLELSVKTIETYRDNIKRKMKLGTANEVVICAANWLNSRRGGRKSAS